MAGSSFSFHEERHQSHFPLSSPAAGSVEYLNWAFLIHELLRLALLILETGLTGSHETRKIASGGHLKSVDGLSLRKLGAWGSLGKLSAGVFAEWRGVVPSDCRMLNLRVHERRSYFSRETGRALLVEPLQR